MKKIEKAQELQDKDTFAMRSCWECNPAHEHLKKANGLMVCFECERWFFQGGYLCDEEHAESEVEDEC